LYILPKGKRKQQLQHRFDRFINQAFQFRLLDFDQHAASTYGDIMGEAKLMGHPMSIPDGQIATIARMKGFILVTRNIKDFQFTGIPLINPFTT